MPSISDIFLEKIEIEASAKTGKLELSGGDLAYSDKLQQLPSELFSLTHLAYLDLHEPQIKTLPVEIDRLSNLRYLNLAKNSLSSLPRSLARLTGLTGINIEGNRFNEIPPWLDRLENLESLVIGGTGHLDLPDVLGNLTKLKFLRLYHMGLEQLPDWLFKLQFLKSLDIQGNDLSTIDPRLFERKTLEYLNLGDNPLRALDERIGNLTNLRNLTLYRTGIAQLPPTIVHLDQLRELTLWNNLFTEIPEVIYHLRHLEELSFKNNTTGRSERDNNQITEVPEQILELSRLRTLELDDNPISTPPPEIVAQGIGAIRDFYEQLTRVGQDLLYEAKLLIVGEGGAGKTTLMNKILDPEYILHDTEKSTEGIAVRTWSFVANEGNDFRVNIWDFGGQEIYHATHQFFLTKRSLYILVADTRKDDTDFFYWLHVIELLGDRSPVIIVKNEKQDRRREVDERQLRGRFENLVQIVAVNLATNRGLEELLSVIRSHVSRLPHVGTGLPRTWVRVQRTLEAEDANTLSVESYLEVCRQNGFMDENQSFRLSEYLHDLGVCLHFKDDAILRKVLILKPTWGTAAVYCVLDNKEVISAWGQLNRSDLESIWHTDEYSGMHDELLQLMLKFGLCYKVPEAADTFIAPQLLRASQPEYDWNPIDNLEMRYVYEFMPKGIVIRLIVAVHRLIAAPQLVWRSGVVLEREGGRAEILEDYQGKQVKVRVAGVHRKELLTIIAYELEAIHSTFAQLRYRALIPCNCKQCSSPGAASQFFAFDVLRKFAADGQRMIQCQKSYTMVEVTALIDDIRAIAEPIAATGGEQGAYHFNALIANLVINQTRADMSSQSERVIRSAWANGSFYLVLCICVLGILGFLSNTIPAYSLGLIVLGGMLLIPMVGALQLRQDERLSQKTFIQLMGLVISQLPLIRGTHGRSDFAATNNLSGGAGAASVSRRAVLARKSTPGK